MSAYCELASPPFEVDNLVCECDKPPLLMSGTGIPEDEGKRCRRCFAVPRVEGKKPCVSICVLKRNHRGRHSWA